MAMGGMEGMEEGEFFSFTEGGGDERGRDFFIVLFYLLGKALG